MASEIEIEKMLPIYKVEGNSILSVFGDFTIGFRVVLQASAPASSYASSYSKSSISHQSNMSSDVDRLEDLMQSLQNGNGDNKEMAQLNAVLEKILEIQNPEKIKDKQKKHSQIKPLYILNNSETPLMATYS